MKLHTRALFVPALALALAACGSDAKDKPKAETDPALTGALADQIMVDPDLAQSNQGGAALAGGGPAVTEIPTELRSPEAIAAARADALKLAGGTLRPVPAAVAGSGSGDDLASLADLAGGPGGSADCAGKADYTAAWAAKLPGAFPVYPRGHTREAAGTDQNGCKLRVVNFVTPVGIDDVLGFYATRAHGAGFDAEHRTEGLDHVLGGSKGSAAYVVYARKTADGLTEVDLVVNGV